MHQCGGGISKAGKDVIQRRDDGDAAPDAKKTGEDASDASNQQKKYDQRRKFCKGDIHSPVLCRL
jgi:hypothetical protein